MYQHRLPARADLNPNTPRDSSPVGASAAILGTLLFTLPDPPSFSPHSATVPPCPATQALAPTCRSENMRGSGESLLRKPMTPLTYFYFWPRWLSVYACGLCLSNSANRRSWWWCTVSAWRLSRCRCGLRHTGCGSYWHSTVFRGMGMFQEQRLSHVSRQAGILYHETTRKPHNPSFKRNFRGAGGNKSALEKQSFECALVKTNFFIVRVPKL